LSSDPASAEFSHRTNVIVEIAGQSITNIYDYTSALDLLKIGQPVKVIYTGAGKGVETR
jgi:S1-C subfamily serine protease